MHILFITDNFPPEGNAPATRTYEHIREWIKKDHHVTVVTCAPNFPEGKVYKGYKNKWLSKENINGINVWRVKTYITANEGFVKRTLDFISFMLSSILFGLFVRKVDVVIGTSPQFFTAISAWVLAKMKRAYYVFELRDIWPASITAVGAMRGSMIIDILEKIEIFLYKQADLIITVTNSFKIELKNRGISADKIKVVLNGVDLSIYKPTTYKDIDFANNYNLQNKFVAGYIGTHGLAHALDNVVKAANFLKADDNIRVLLVGGGSERERLEELVKKQNLSNVVMMPRQPKKYMQRVWSLCDISIISLRDDPLFSTVIPSKIFESMAMGLPIIISVPKGESTDIIKNENAGLITSTENPANLAESISHIKNNMDIYNNFSKNSLLASTKYNRKNLALKMLRHIENLEND